MRVVTSLLLRSRTVAARATGFAPRATRRGASAPAVDGETSLYYNAAQWDSLARYHAGDWRGFWTTFAPDENGRLAKVSERQVRTHLGLNKAKDAVVHVNTYHGEDDEDDLSQAYGIYARGDPLRSKHLPHAFLFGPGLLPPAVAGAGSFASELGLRVDDAFRLYPGGRVRAVAVHGPAADGVARLEKLTVIREVDGDDDAYGPGRLYFRDDLAPGPWHGTVERWVDSGTGVKGGPLEVVEKRPGAVEAPAGHLAHEFDGGIRVVVPREWAAGDAASFVLEWTPTSSNKCLVARMDATLDEVGGAPGLDAFTMEDLVKVAD